MTGKFQHHMMFCLGKNSSMIISGGTISQINKTILFVFMIISGGAI
jgi:hypothetical protein